MEIFSEKSVIQKPRSAKHLSVTQTRRQVSATGGEEGAQRLTRSWMGTSNAVGGRINQSINRLLGLIGRTSWTGNGKGKFEHFQLKFLVAPLKLKSKFQNVKKLRIPENVVVVD